MGTKRSIQTPVPAKRIRQAFQSNERGLDALTIVDSKGKPVSPNAVLGRDGDVSRVRGRLNPAHVAAFLDKFPEHTYAEKSQAEGKSISLPVTKTSKSGATLQRPVDVPMSEFRRLSGQAKGRPSRESLTRAAEAYKAENGLS